MTPTLRTAFFLTVRYIKRGSRWTTILIIFITTLTFLNLVVVYGILVGLTEGSVNAFRNFYSGDVIIQSLEEEDYILRTQAIRKIVESHPDVEDVVLQYVTNTSIEQTYVDENGRRITSTLRANLIGVNANDIIGRSLKNRLLDGEFIEENDGRNIIIGRGLLAEYSPAAGAFDVLQSVAVGDQVTMYIEDIEYTYNVVGILKSKLADLDLSILTDSNQLREILGRSGHEADFIAVFAKPGVDPLQLKADFIAAGADKFADVETSQEAIGVFLDDIKNTFIIISSVIGFISLLGASVTIFIVIFISAIARKRFIGILKAIGISGAVIEYSYVLLAMFYALAGIIIGALLLVFVIEPYFFTHPIDFPFSDGILFTSLPTTATRTLAILFATLIAGYVPAKMIVRKRALDAMLGR